MVTLLKKSKRMASSLRPYTASTAKKPLAGSMKKQRRLYSMRSDTQPMHVRNPCGSSHIHDNRLLESVTQILRPDDALVTVDSGFKPKPDNCLLME